MPMPAALAHTDELPEMSYPRIMMMATDGLKNAAGESVTWGVGDDHPLATGMRVVAIYINGPVVEIYSMASSSKNGMRDLVPLHRVRLINETMPLDVFGEELARSEMGVDDDDDDDEPEPEPEPEPDPTSPPAS